MPEAEEAAHEAVAWLKKMDSRDDAGRARVNAGLRLLAGILWDEGKPTEAQAAYDEAFRNSPEYLTQQIQALKTQSDDATRGAGADQPPRSPIQGSEKYFFRQTNVIQNIPGWGGLIDPEGGCAVKVDHGTLTVSIPEATHPIGQLVASEVIDGITTNSVCYTGRQVRILQAVKGDFTVETKVSWKWDRKLKAKYADDSYFFDAGLLLVDGTNTIEFCAFQIWRSIDWSAERRSFLKIRWQTLTTTCFHIIQNPVSFINFHLMIPNLIFQWDLRASFPTSECPASEERFIWRLVVMTLLGLKCAHYHFGSLENIMVGLSRIT